MILDDSVAILVFHRLNCTLKWTIDSLQCLVKPLSAIEVGKSLNIHSFLCPPVIFHTATHHIHTVIHTVT